MVGIALLALLGTGCGLGSDLLLLILLEPLIAPAHSAGQPAHRRARGGSSARVTRYRAAHRAAPRAAPFTTCPCGGIGVTEAAGRSEAAAWALLGSNPVCLTAHE